MRAAEADADDRTSRSLSLCFALGKALEDRGDYAESWRFYERGNALKRTESRYRPEIMETNTRQQIEVCTRRVLRQPRAAGGVQDPIRSSSSACRARARR